MTENVTLAGRNYCPSPGVPWLFGNMLRRFLDALSYPRGVIVSLLVAVGTFFLSLVFVTVAALVRKRAVLDFIMNDVWSRSILWLAGVRFEVRGGETVSRDGKGFLLLFNHSSHVDIPVLYAGFPRSFRFGAKIELFKIPAFGTAMRLAGVLPIDRRNRNKVMRVYQEAISRVENGECFALAPEGTRQPQPKLGPFKRGPFEFAINAGMDVVPVVLAGTYAVLPKSKLWLNQGRWRRKVIMSILPRVSTAEYALENVDALVERVRAQMQVVHDAVYQELGPQGV